jgi:hypothetical protein
MAFGKLNILVLALLAGGGMLWVEHSHRTKIEVSTPTELAERNAAVCPENESVPFSADCMTFIQGGVGSNVRVPVNAAEDAESPELP